ALLQYTVAATRRRGRRLPFDARRLEQAPNSLRNQARVHDFALDDRVGGDLGGRDLSQLGFAAPVIDHHEFDDAGADIEADRRFFATKKAKKSHSAPFGLETSRGEGKLQ